MLYYRRKILLALLEAFGGQLGKIDLQKLLLILCKLQKKPSFEFVPHRFGCYSYQSSWDLQALKTYEIISDTETSWQIEKKDNYTSLLTGEDKSHLKHIQRTYNGFGTDQLMKVTYLQFPYYAIRSEKASTLLDENQYRRITDLIPDKIEPTLFTIGYEGISIETYFNKLIRNNVRVLCDVRRNALSQKFGFSKSILSKVCNSLGIEYIHIPNLGISSEKRQNLKTQRDYDNLFDEYEKEYLVHQGESLQKILDLLDTHQRVAITCFEASYCQCHRSKVAKGLSELPTWNIDIKHL